MARTTQTARQSTGKRAPTKNISAKAARNSYADKFIFNDDKEKICYGSIGDHIDPKFVNVDELSHKTAKTLWPYLGRSDVKKVVAAANETLDV